MHKLDSVVRALQSGEVPQLIESTQQSRQNALADLLLDRDTIMDLWRAMVRMYGHKWTSNYGEMPDPGNVWARCLKGLTAEQIKTGLGACVSLALEWPPSAPQFLNLCMKKHVEADGTDTSWQHNWIARNDRGDASDAHQPMRLENLTDKEERKAKGRARMAQLRAETGI